jgi:translation initiation factor IF-2
VVINDGMSLESLKREKNDVREVKAGLECGIKLAGFDDVKIADIIELYEKVEIARTLSSVAAENAQQSPAD